MIKETNTPIINPNKIYINKKHQNNPTFKAKTSLVDKYLAYKSKDADNLAVDRFIQDTATNWIPKVVFTRGLADFGDMSFLEFVESAIFYFLPTSFGKFFKKSYEKFHPENLKKTISSNLSRSAEEILNDKDLKKDDVGKRILSTKAAIILGCTAIPAAEYGLSFAKNLFTLKVFHKSDFNNIANLNKDQVEDKEHQEKLKASAHSHLKNAGLLSLGGLAASVLFAKYGHKSEVLQNASSLILQPGAHIANGLRKIGLIKAEDTNKGLSKFLKKYITPDFDRQADGSFGLSKGQLLVTTVSGFFGYSAAAKDRGKLDQYEVWTRVPFVVLYTVFGGTIFDNLFKKVLTANNIFPDVIKKDEKDKAKYIITETKDLASRAAEIAKKKVSEVSAASIELEFKKLKKQKAIITAFPTAFSFVFMGLFLSGITRFWTQYRYNHGKGSEVKTDANKNQEKNINFSQLQRPDIFNAFY